MKMVSFLLYGAGPARAMRGELRFLVCSARKLW
jgi:hypothetical protein